MTDASGEIVVRYDSAGEATRALKEMRGFGFRRPREHLVVEGARIALILVPVALLFAGVIRADHVIATLCGYFALRLFDGRLKPALFRRFGPVFPGTDASEPLTIVFDADGLRSGTRHFALRAGWAAIATPERFATGMIFRIAPELSIAVAARNLPGDLGLDAFARRIEIWRQERPA